ncbi:MAG: DNA-formamidopyrimidine glycosylase family protein, partial [Vicinamibacteria bacterium]
MYLEGLEPRILGHTLEKVRLATPFVLRTVLPPIREAEGTKVTAIRRLGKRIVIGLEEDLFLVLHLMIAGRLRWKARGSAIPGRIGLAALDFPSGTLLVTEAGSKKRASLHLVRGAASLSDHDPGGLEVLEADLAAFRAALTRESHTLKRALTDPRLFSGIGNAYSDEILHRARLSPVRRVGDLDEGEIARLYEATGKTLLEWTERLRKAAGEDFPKDVTAFRDGMA